NGVDLLESLGGEDLLEPSEDEADALLEIFRGALALRLEGAAEVLEHLAKLLDELRVGGGDHLEAFLRRAPAEVLELGVEAEVLVLELGDLGPELRDVGGSLLARGRGGLGEDLVDALRG